MREEDPFERIVADAEVLDIVDSEPSFETLIDKISGIVSKKLPDSADYLEEHIDHVKRMGPTPIAQGVALPHMHLPGIEHPMLIIVRARKGLMMEHDEIDGEAFLEAPIYAMFMLISEEEKARQHLRMLAQIAVSVDADGFIDEWCAAKNEQAMKEILLRDERFISLKLDTTTESGQFVGKALKEIRLPESALVVLIRRERRTLIPHGNTILQEGDRLTIIGDPKDIRFLYREYVVDVD